MRGAEAGESGRLAGDAGGLSVAVFSEVLAHFRVHGFIAGLPGGEAVYVAVEHAEGGGNQDGVVNLDVGGVFGAGAGDVFGGDIFAAQPDFAGDREERFEFGGDGRGGGIGGDAFDDGGVTCEVGGGGGSVAGGAEEAIVLRGDVGGNQFAFSKRQWTWQVEELMGEVAQGPGGLGAEGEAAGDSGDSFRERDVGHQRAPVRAGSEAAASMAAAVAGSAA